MATILDKDMVNIPQSKYERLIENETRYDQLFNAMYNVGSNNKLLETIDHKKYNELTKLKPQNTSGEPIELRG